MQIQLHHLWVLRVRAQKKCSARRERGRSLGTCELQLHLHTPQLPACSFGHSTLHTSPGKQQLPHSTEHVPNTSTADMPQASPPLKSPKAPFPLWSLHFGPGASVPLIWLANIFHASEARPDVTFDNVMTLPREKSHDYAGPTNITSL